MTGHLDEATETWVDLDAMLAAELPPCELRPNGLVCRYPSAALLKAKCQGCALARQFAVCGPCREYLRWYAPKGIGCTECGGLITVRGLS